MVEASEILNSEPENDFNPVRRAAADRTLSVLELIASANEAVPVKAIGTRLGLPKPTAHRLVNNLLEKKFLARTAGTRDVTIGPEATKLGMKILRSSLLLAPRRAALRQISAEIGETCNIGVLDGDAAIYVDRVEVEHSPLRLQFGVGSRVPLHCSALGKLFLAYLPDSKRMRTIQQLSFTRYTGYTLLDENALTPELQRIRANGYAIDDEEFIAGVFCVAVPVPAVTGRSMVAIAAQGPKARLSHNRLPEVLQCLQRGAELFAVLLKTTTS
ncbi:IclR family transcriptional regulator [Indioceanicola profundi]|uniref:IclR family transcriptional regulator n=1 Tax=Indioceanicola profundi TaxID=2220096 RepID=UPI000E6ACCD9|nr:IclR family transcriptional regulator [Indioceanicola profundi]